ncbi:MAG TPA: serpin family protein [Polyangia bacterium]
MRCSILLTSLIGFFLLGAGCGSDQGNNTPDALTTEKQDAAVVNPPDAAVDAQQDVAATGLQDAADMPSQDVAATDTHNTTEVSPRDIAGVDTQAGIEAGTGEAGSSQGAMASSSLVRVTATLTDTEKTDLATSLSGFAFALWQGLRGDPSNKTNFAFSPTSISLALGMVYAGAQGNTASQMKSSMHVTSASDVYFRSLNWLDAQLESRADAALKQAQNMYKSGGSSGAAPDPANFRLHVVNACWGDRTFTFEQPYLDTLATDFGSGVHLADFRTQPDTERLAINTWVSQETLNRINDLIPQGAIDTTTRTVLVNAIHLKLPWYDPFIETSTLPATFTKTDGSTVSVPFMNKGGRWSYAEDDTTQAVAVPLSGSSVTFVVFLPKATSSLAQFEDSLSQGHATTLVAGMASQQVTLALPKFTFTTASVHLGSVLTALGMTDAFTPSADFTGISKEKPLFISDAVHKAMVGVDEHGVEAAAATAVMLAGSGLPTDIKQVNVNRPFFFGIYDQPTSTWLFLGHITDPSS